MKNIHEYLKRNEKSTVKDISKSLTLTEDQVRYQLIKGLDNEEVIKIEGRPARYSINIENEVDVIDVAKELADIVNLEEEFEEMKIETDIADLEEAIKKDKPKRKILNPQGQINKMVDNCWVFEITMKYSKEEKYWVFAKGKIQIKVKSKELPSIRENLSKWMKENFNE